MQDRDRRKAPQDRQGDHRRSPQPQQPGGHADEDARGELHPRENPREAELVEQPLILHVEDAVEGVPCEHSNDR
eukprot:scaffold1455_cov65-Phaeocystis_antarctica.AAC.11